MTFVSPKRATRGRGRVAACLVVSGFALAACGSAATTTKVGAEAPAAKTASTAAAAKPAVTAAAESGAAATTTVAAAVSAAVPPTLDFTAPLVGGGTFDAKQYAGKKVAFWFWAPT